MCQTNDLTVSKQLIQKAQLWKTNLEDNVDAVSEIGGAGEIVSAAIATSFFASMFIYIYIYIYRGRPFFFLRLCLMLSSFVY